MNAEGKVQCAELPRLSAYRSFPWRFVIDSRCNRDAARAKHKNQILENRVDWSWVKLDSYSNRDTGQQTAAFQTLV